MLLPVSYRVNGHGHVEVGGCDLVELARTHGTPLYVYDEETVRGRCREFRDALGSCGEALTTFRHAIDAVPATRNEARADIEKAMSDTSAHCRS